MMPSERRPGGIIRTWHKIFLITPPCIIAFIAVIVGIFYQLAWLGWSIVVVITLVCVIGAAIVGYSVGSRAAHYREE